MTQLITEAELQHLFGNESQRHIFIKLINRLIERIEERVVIHGVQIHTKEPD